MSIIKSGAYSADRKTIDTSTLETKIDQMVYKLYHLTTDEINTIEDEK